MSQIYDLWCKRHLFFPKISMKIFSDRNFCNLPTNDNFCTPRKFHKNRKKSKFPKLYMGWGLTGMSSDACKWEVCVLLMVLRPILDPIDTLDVIFKNDEFSWIFKIYICGSNYSNFEIGRYRPGKYDLTLEISSLILEPHYIQ